MARGSLLHVAWMSVAAFAAVATAARQHSELDLVQQQQNFAQPAPYQLPPDPRMMGTVSGSDIHHRDLVNLGGGHRVDAASVFGTVQPSVSATPIA